MSNPLLGVEGMTSVDVLAYVANKWPNALQSPVARACRDTAGAQMAYEAMNHALSCLDQCDGWDTETLGHNIESNFPELDIDACDAIAAAPLRARK